MKPSTRKLMNGLARRRQSPHVGSTRADMAKWLRAIKVKHGRANTVADIKGWFNLKTRGDVVTRVAR